MEKSQSVETQKNDRIGIPALKRILNNESIQKKFSDMLGKKAAGFITSVINVCQNNSMLSNADANSVVLAAASAAALDLPVNPNLGYSAIIPYNDKKRNITTASFQVMRNGWVELAQRTGQVEKLENEIVYEGELVSQNRFKGEFIFDESKKKSDNVIGYMAYVKLLNGFEKTVYWDVEKCKKHAKQYSQTYRLGYGNWIDNFDSMCLKSVLKHLIVKYLPKSIELNMAIERDQAELKGDIDNIEPSYIDNVKDDEQFVDFEEVEQNKK